MIGKEMAQAINRQITAETYSAYLYMSMSAYAAHAGFSGIANWFYVQTQEELTHALRLYKYLNSLGVHVRLEAIDQPPTDFDSVQALFDKSLEHEQKVTGLINGLMNMAVEQRDHATEIFLQWFVTEQVEEEESVNDILARLKMAGSEGGMLFMLDRELGQRVFAMPAELAQGR